MAGLMLASMVMLEAAGTASKVPVAMPPLADQVASSYNVGSNLRHKAGMDRWWRRGQFANINADGPADVGVNGDTGGVVDSIGRDYGDGSTRVEVSLLYVVDRKQGMRQTDGWLVCDLG